MCEEHTNWYQITHIMCLHYIRIYKCAIEMMKENTMRRIKIEYKYCMLKVLDIAPIVNTLTSSIGLN